MDTHPELKPTIENLAEVMDAIDALGLSSHDRCDARSAVFVAGRVLLGQTHRPTPDELRTISTTDLAQLSARCDALVAQEPAGKTRTLTQQKFSRLRTTLRAVGLDICEANGLDRYSDAWEEVLELLSERGRELVTALARWATAQNIPPTRLTNDDFHRFVAAQQAKEASVSIQNRTRDIVMHLKRLRKAEPGLNLQELTNPLPSRFKSHDDIPTKLSKEITDIAHHAERFGAKRSPTTKSNCIAACERLVTIYHNEFGVFPGTLAELSQPAVAERLIALSLHSSERSNDERHNPKVADTQHTISQIREYFTPDAIGHSQSRFIQYESHTTRICTRKLKILRHFHRLEAVANFLCRPEIEYESITQRAPRSDAEILHYTYLFAWALLTVAPIWPGAILDLAHDDTRLHPNLTKPAELILDLSVPCGRVETPAIYNIPKPIAKIRRLYIDFIRLEDKPGKLICWPDGRDMNTTQLCRGIRSVTGEYLKVELTPSDIRDIAKLIFLANRSLDPTDAAQWTGCITSNKFKALADTVLQWSSTGAFEEWPEYTI